MATGIFFPLEIEPSNTIQSVKELIQDKEGIPPNRQKLMFGIEQLEDGYTSVSYTHLRAHETLRYLVCRLLLEKKIET